MNGNSKKHHRRESSQWNPQTPITEYFNASFRQRSESSRAISPNTEPGPARYELHNYRKYRTNEVVTTKYNALTFIPKDLYQQFHRIANIYFVIIIVLEYFPEWSSVNGPVATIPVVLILVLTGIKDALEDLRRRRLDSQVNNAYCHVWDSASGRFRKMCWKLVLVGDVVHISNDEILPADVLLVRTSCDDGNAFLETSNLDGESNLKYRNVPKMFASICGEHNTVNYSTMNISNIMCAPPTKNLREIHGSVEWNGTKEAISLNNVLLRGCRLKNTTFIEGVVIYAGHDTKMMLNGGRAPHKRSKAEGQTNIFVIGCAIVLLIYVVISVVNRAEFVKKYPSSDSAEWVSFALTTHNDLLDSIVSFIICYQLIIPLSLYITVELIKLGQAYLLVQDLEMYSEAKDEAFIARSLSSGEELGQLTHVLSDKTGTLTQNKMILRFCATPNDVLNIDETCELDDNQRKSFDALMMCMVVCNSVFVYTSPRKDAIDAGFYDDGIFSIGNSNFYTYTEEEFDGRVAEFEAQEKNGSGRLFEGESPDEIALVKGVLPFGYELVGRASGAVHLKLPNGDYKTLNVLCTIPFDPVRKRMSVCVEGENEDEVIIYTKGADSSMLCEPPPHLFRPSVVLDIPSPIMEEDEDLTDSPVDTLDSQFTFSQDTVTVLQEHVDEFSRKGLRTLVLGMHVMKREAFDDWHDWFKTVEQSHGDHEGEKLMMEIANRIEVRTVPIGVTAVEDKLQEGVSQCIASLREAGIQIWVLTGDKKETAEGVALSCGLFVGQPVTITQEYLEERMYMTQEKIGAVLPPELVMSADPAHFGEFLKKCSTVLCYRMTPSQKAEIVKYVKKTGGMVAAIGDGANDVPMIQAAHVGIGISGSEGMQASMAADFVISEFSFLSRLLLLHGHWNYARLAHVLLYFLYKNIQNTAITFCTQIFNGWSGSYPQDQLYSMMYPIIFTSLQPLLYGIYEQDCTEEHLLKHPELYLPGQQGRLYNLRMFVLNAIDGVWQGAVCYFFSYMLIVDTSHSSAYFGYILMTTQFLVNNCHLLLETRCWNAPTIAVQLLGVVLHYGYFFVISELATPGNKLGLNDDEYHIAEYALTDVGFWATCIITIMAALFPRFVARVLLN